MEGSVADRKWLGFSVALHEAETEASARSAFRSLIESYGLDTFACGSFDALDLASSSYLSVGWPENFAKFYYGDQRLSPDPMRTIIPTAPGPVAWSDLLSSSRRGRAMRRSVEMSSDFGWRESLVIPLSPPATRRFIVSVKGPRGALSPEEREVLTRAGTAFYERLRSFDLTPSAQEDAIELTAREAACLTLIALGLSDEAVGDQLGISQATAHKHIENSKRKLRALNRTHAVAIAVRRRLVSL